jgi:predicted deacetylase
VATAPLLASALPDGDWLPSGKKAAICFGIDDVHPASARDAYDAGGDLGSGALGHVEWLLQRHPYLRVTLFTTPAWRLRSPLPTRRLLSRLPLARQALFLAPVHSPHRMRIDRHRAFVEYLNSLPGAEIALHGLHHARRGPAFHVEFRGRSRRACRAMLERALQIAANAGLRTVPGFQAPGWEVHDDLADALVDTGFQFVAGARDVRTPIAAGAVCDMSGPRGVSLLHPQPIAAGRLTHVATNFQATSPIDRAVEIAEHGGLISIKAHIYKRAYSYVALDGLDLSYRDYLDRVFSFLADRYGNELWWTSMNEIASHRRRSETDPDLL